MKRTSLILILVIITLALGIAFRGQEEIGEDVSAGEIIDTPLAEDGTAPQEITSAPKIEDEDSEEMSRELDKLPTLEDLRLLSEEEVHHTPQAILDGGRVIAQLIEKAENEPVLREHTVNLLLECAEAENIAASIRAVCWKNTISSIEKWKVFVPISNAKISPRVQELSSRLP